MPSPQPTDSSDSPEWAEVQEDVSSPVESNLITGPVITFVRTERKEVSRRFRLQQITVLIHNSEGRHKTAKHNVPIGVAKMSK